MLFRSWTQAFIRRALARATMFSRPKSRRRRRVWDEQNSQAGVVSLERRQLLAAPVIINNQGLTASPGETVVVTPAILLATDTDNTPDQLVYTITTAPTQGVLQKSTSGSWSALGAGGQFTQDDVNSSRLRYVHGGSAVTTDGFAFSLTDGTQGTPNVTRVSVGAGGSQGNGFSYASAISADGRYVTYSSDASNLVAGDTNGAADVFV